MLPFGLSATVGAKQVELFANTLGVRLGCGRKGQLGFHGESSVWGLVTGDTHLCRGENSMHGENGWKSNFSSSTEELGWSDKAEESQNTQIQNGSANCDSCSHILPCMS